MSESSFGPGAGVDGGESSQDADVNAGYEDTDVAGTGEDVPGMEDSAVDNSHSADIDAGYDEESSGSDTDA